MHRVPILGKAEDATVVRSTEAGVDGLRVEGDNIFVLFRDGRIGKATLGDASSASLKEVFALPPQYPQNLLDEANVYFTYGDRISKIPRSF